MNRLVVHAFRSWAQLLVTADVLYTTAPLYAWDEQVQGEADVHLATADDRQTLGQAFTEYYGLDVAAGSVIAELRQSPDGAGACQLGLQGQKGTVLLLQTLDFWYDLSLAVAPALGHLHRYLLTT